MIFNCLLENLDYWLCLAWDLKITNWNYFRYGHCQTLCWRNHISLISRLFPLNSCFDIVLFMLEESLWLLLCDSTYKCHLKRCSKQFSVDMKALVIFVVSHFHRHWFLLFFFPFRCAMYLSLQTASSNIENTHLEIMFQTSCVLLFTSFDTWNNINMVVNLFFSSHVSGRKFGMSM